MSDIQEMVDDAKRPGVFNIVDAVRGRAYPKDEVDVFIDEKIAFEVAAMNELIDGISNEMDKTILNKKEVDEFIKRRDEVMDERDRLIKEMGGNKYVFHITGVSEGARQDMYEKAVEKFPIKYEKNRNPLTGVVEKEEVENSERDRYFTALLWEAYISKVVAPDGSEQNGITYEDAVELRRSLPLAAISTITEAIEKMRAATALFMLSVNEDFLAKS